MGEATGMKIQTTLNEDTSNSDSDKTKVIIIGSSRVMGLDAEYIDQIIGTNGKKVDVFNRGLSSDLPSRRLTVLDQSISDHPDVVLIGIDFENYLKKSESSFGLATETKFKNCGVILPTIQDTYSLFTIHDNLFGIDSTNFNNPKLSTLKIISKALKPDTNLNNEAKSQEIKTLFDKSVMSANAGNLEEAIAYNNKILELDPNYYDAILNNGNFLLRINKIDEASYFVNKAVSIAPDSILANYNKQSLLEKQGKIQESRFIAKKIEELEKQKTMSNDFPSDFEASKSSLKNKQSWRFDEPSWRIVQNDQSISSVIKKEGNLIQYSMPFESNGNEAKSLIKIIQRLKQDNIHVVLFTSPLYKELFYAADSCQMKNFEDFVQKLSRDFDIPVYYLHDKYLGLNIWRDQVHIIWGKTIYTEDVAKIILKEI